MRLFVAVDLSEEARQAMAAEQKRIASALGVGQTSLKWVRQEHMHLTLVFLGSVDEPRARTVVDVIGRDVDAAPFDMVFDGVGAFPPHGEPRVLWTGVTQGAADLVALHRELGQRAAALGIALEDRSFHPHLTLGRWRESRAAVIANARLPPEGTIRSRVCASNGRRCTRADYHRLARPTPRWRMLI